MKLRRTRPEADDAARKVVFGPCCFCNEQIAPVGVDPCRVTVEKMGGEWQVWFCHARCFREHLATREDDLLKPAHF
jgi:hypothetical protein